MSQGIPFHGPQIMPVYPLAIKKHRAKHIGSTPAAAGGSIAP